MDDCKTEVKESSEQSDELEKAFTIGMAIGFGKKYDEMDRIMEMIKALTPCLCRDCKWWKDSDGEYRRGSEAESPCPINRIEVFEGNGYCYMYEPQESGVTE